MKELKNRINLLIEKSNGDKRTIEAIRQDESVAPFSTENKLLAYLLYLGEINFDDYSELSKKYCERSKKSNQYLYLFDMAPRTFGQTWGEKHIRKLYPEFVKATKKNLATLYPNFDGEFDLWIDGIRVEIKACRASSTTSKGSLSVLPLMEMDFCHATKP
ncbi:MAG: hypothetical protein ACOX2O_05990 [Bdellovibrionota bacterium]